MSPNASLEKASHRIFCKTAAKTGHRIQRQVGDAEEAGDLQCLGKKHNHINMAEVQKKTRSLHIDS